MIKISEAVLELLKHDEIAAEAFSQDLLNLSAYADKICKQVEKLTLKSVKKSTIVVSLSRISKNQIGKSIPLKSEVKINHLSVKSPVKSLSYKKTADVQRRIATLNPFFVNPADLFATIDGAREIVIICTSNAIDLIKNHIGQNPKEEIDDLVAITVEFPAIYNTTPNVLYTLFSALATRRINVVNMISTFSETSFIVDKNDMESVISILNLYT